MAEKATAQKATAQKVMTIDNTERQEQYVEKQKARGHGLGIVFQDAFLRGMRDIGYKNPVWALAEMVDNSIQAGADTVAIRFGYKPGSTQVRPDMVALCDNGNGMIPEMIGYAIRWGGTDREGDRTGFGRYGYGLPSSAVSLAKKYTVYSQVSGGEPHAVTVDLDALAEIAGDVEKTETLLAAKPAKLPAWVTKGKSDDKMDLSKTASWTVVVLEDLDRLRKLAGWIKVDTLRTKLLQEFGVIYRHWVPARQIVIDGVQMSAVDPLFLMEHGRFYDETSVRAEGVEARSFEVEAGDGKTGTVRIRASVMPPNFGKVDPKDIGKGGKNNKRFEVIKDYNGLLICRQGRQIDCISPKWMQFQNNDRYIKVEVNFDPVLDEYFGITTAKQQIVVADEMWEKLKSNGKNGGALLDLITDLRDRWEEMDAALKAKKDNQAGDEQRSSEKAMEESEKFKGTVVEPTPAEKEEAEKNLTAAAAEQAEKTGQPPDEVLAQLREKTEQRRWQIVFQPVPEGPFYRPARLGLQKHVMINTQHPFYAKVYNASSPEVRAALEVLMFVFAERELEVRGATKEFYRAERTAWSERLRSALEALLPDAAMVDKANSVAEELYETGNNTDTDAEESAP